jgi:hypothetical protein
VIFFPSKQVSCDGVWVFTCIAIYILDIGVVRYIRNLKTLTTFSGEGSSGANW